MSLILGHSFALHEQIDAAASARCYAREGRVAIAPFLTEASAAALREHLLARDDWTRVMNAGDRVYELPRAAAASLTADQRELLDRKLGEAAVCGFQYRYESIRIADDPEARGDTLLDRFANFLDSPPVLALVRTVTAVPIDFLDAQATAYGPGDFLTAHDDDVAGKNRRAAYVFGLTRGWRAEWGGLLLFHGAEGEIAHGFVPGFNTLRLFAVPVLHSVSPVWPYAPETRLSVTGWARSRVQRG